MKIGRVYGTMQVDFKYTEHYLAEELHQLGHETTFITSNRYLRSWEKYLKTKNTMGTYEYDFFKVIRLAAYFPLEKVIFKNLFKLNRLLFRSGFDILHLYGLGNISTLQVLFLAALKGKNAPPIIISDHTSPETHIRGGISSKIYKFIVKIMLWFVKFKIEKIISFSNIGVDLLAKNFNISKDRFEVIPLGYNQNRFQYTPQKKKKHEKFIIGYAGKINAKKRIDVLINTLNDINDLHDKIKLIIVGIDSKDLYCNSLQELAKETNVAIEFRPFANSDELALFYNEIDLAIYPGSISITTIEANGCGVPVIIYKSIEDLQKRVENGRGRLFETPKELKAHILDYFEMFNSNKIHREKIAQETSTSSSWFSIKDRYLEIFNKTLIE